MESKIDEIKQSVNVLLTDMKYLRGKTIRQLFEMRKRKINQNRKIIELRSIYVDLKTKEKNIKDNKDDDETFLLTYGPIE